MRSVGRILYEASAVPSPTHSSGTNHQYVTNRQIVDGSWPMVDADTVLVSVALVATNINTLLTTFTLLHQVNEKTKLIKTLHTVSSALIIVAKKRPLRTGLREARVRLAQRKIRCAESRR